MIENVKMAFLIKRGNLKPKTSNNILIKFWDTLIPKKSLQKYQKEIFKIIC